MGLNRVPTTKDFYIRYTSVKLLINISIKNIKTDVDITNFVTIFLKRTKTLRLYNNNVDSILYSTLFNLNCSKALYTENLIKTDSKLI